LWNGAKVKTIWFPIDVEGIDFKGTNRIFANS